MYVHDMHGVSNREILHYIVVCVFACVLVCIRLAGAVLVQGSGPGVRPAEQDPEKMDCGFVACTAGSCPTNRDGKSTTHKHTSLRTHTYSNAQEHKTITHMHTDTCAYTYTNTCTQTRAHTQTHAHRHRHTHIHKHGHTSGGAPFPPPSSGATQFSFHSGFLPLGRGGRLACNRGKKGQASRRNLKLVLLALLLDGDGCSACTGNQTAIRQGVAACRGYIQTGWFIPSFWVKRLVRLQESLRLLKMTQTPNSTPLVLTRRRKSGATRRRRGNDLP